MEETKDNIQGSQVDAATEADDDDDEESLSVEELETEVTRLRAKVSQLQAVLWKLGFDKEGKKRL